MAINSIGFELGLYEILKNSNEINSQIVFRKIRSIITIKKAYLLLKKKIDEMVSKDLTIAIRDRNVKCNEELNEELDKMYHISLHLFKSYWWGEFSKVTNKSYPEIYSMMIDQSGDLLRSFDDFSGTVAAMDFHGYTQFSKDIKYNKTPLQEFGDVLPQKIEHICNACKSIVYEMEGDALIIIGPENPVYIFNAVLSIIELCRQKPFNPNSNPKVFHHIEINNPMIKSFEMNASITTGGRVFINKNGRIVGSLISEASRILKIINTKKPNKSGILLSDKIFRRLEKYRETKTNSHVSVFDFKISDPFLVDVKGTRLNLREVYLEEKKYIEDTTEYSKKLSEEIRKKASGKWINILTYYLNLILTCLMDIKCNVQIGGENLNQDKVRKKLEILFYDWITETKVSTLKEILRISSVLYENSEEVRDVIAIYHEFIQENYGFLAKSLEEFYETSLEKEGNSSITTKKIIEGYNKELDNLKKKFPSKRIIDTILSSDKILNQMTDVPYMGKK